jgi:hypothetical protein
MRPSKAQGFRHHAHAPLQIGAIGVEAMPENLDLARRRVEESGQAANGGTLSRAVRPQEAEHGARRHA